MGFDVHRAAQSWRERYPYREERIAKLQAQLELCETERTLRLLRGGQRKVEFPQTAKNLRLLIAMFGGEIMD